MVAAIVLASGIVIASQQQSGDRPASGAGSEVRQQLTLDATGTTATNDKDSLAVSVADKAAPKKPSQTVRQPRMLQLQQMKEELRDVLGNLTSQKAAMDAELEAQELEEDLLKRELYHLHQTLNELKLSLIQSEPGAGQEGLQTQLDTILHQATQVKEKYKQQLQRTAELMAKLEQHEAERTNVRLRLDQLESLLTQLELQQQLAPGAQRAVGEGMTRFGLPTAISEGPLPPDTIAA